jgi:hypothetical protein
MRTVFMLLLALTKCSLSFAQAPTITIQNAVLRLGMTQSEVAAELGKQPALFLDKSGNIANEPPSNAGDADSMKHFRLYATAKFSNGHLIYVEKFWRNQDSPDSALVLMNALFGAASSVAGDGRLCTLRAWTSTEPDQDYKETSIQCQLPGATRSIHAFIKTFHYDRDLHSVQVNEVLETRVAAP